MRSERHSILRQIQKSRDRVPLPKTVGEMFDGSVLKAEYNDHRPARRALTRYQERGALAALKMGQDGYKVPYGVKVALASELYHTQIVHRHPWAVVWFSNGKRYAAKKTTLVGAVQLHRQLILEYGVLPANATIISRSRGYDIPAKLRGKLPKPWKWCPRCMKPRKFQLHPSGQTTHVRRKEWSEDYQRYEFKERLVNLLWCPVCKTTHRDPVFRRSNQPWEIRKFRRGARKAKPRYTTNNRRRRRR
jgi:predicted ATPase